MRTPAVLILASLVGCDGPPARGADRGAPGGPVETGDTDAAPLLPIPIGGPADGSAAWDARTVYAAPGRTFGNAGVTGTSDDLWITWDDVLTVDRSDNVLRLVRVRADVIEPPLVIGNGIRTGDSVRPAIGSTSAGDLVFVSALTTCDERWASCPPPPLDRQIELIVHDPVAGTTVAETVDVRNDLLDHGRGDLAVAADGSVHVCHKVFHGDEVGDEVHCSVRSPAGAWSPSSRITGGRPDADDHPNVWLGADGGRAVAFISDVTEGRRAVFQRADPAGALLRHVFVDGGLADDVTIGETPGGVLHLAWRDIGEPDDMLRHATCATATQDCSLDASWTITSLAVGPDIESPELVMVDDHFVVTWTQGDVLQVGWTCPDRGFRIETPDGSGGAESTDRGQPTVRVDRATGAIDVVYVRTTGTGSEVRWARRPVSLCP